MKERRDASLPSAAASVAEAGQQVAIATPPSRDLTPVTVGATSTKDLHVSKNTSTLQLVGQQPGAKTVSQVALAKELDVETNYLRNSQPNFTEELPMKTVFQKIGQPQLPE